MREMRTQDSVKNYMSYQAPPPGLAFSAAHGSAVVCSCNLLKKLRLKPDVVPESAEAVINVRAHIEDEQTLTVDLLDAIRATEAKLKDAPTLVGKLRHPIGHFHESNCAARLNHGERAKRSN